jgi:hypothetical protein
MTLARRRLACSIGGAIALLAARDAAGQTSADKAVAESLFQDGRALMDAGEVAQGCVKLADSYRLEAAIGTLLNLARCHELEGKTASAWAEYRQVAETADKAGQKERATAAREFAARLEPTLSRLVIEVPHATAGIEVTRDGVPVGKGTLSAAVPVDPGDHEIVAAAPGMKTWTAKITIGPNADRQVVTVPVLESVGHAGAGPASAEPPKDQAAASPATDGGSGPPRALMYAAFAVGGAGLVLGVVTGVLAIGKQSDLEDSGHCNETQCDRTVSSDLSSYDTMKALSTVGFVVGGLGVAAGVVLLVTSKQKSPPHAGAARAPVITVRLGAASIEARGAF